MEDVRTEYVKDARKGNGNAKIKINLLDEIMKIYNDDLKKKNE